MRRILIVGAGQAGLQLGLSLLDENYDVTIMSARTPDEIRNGRVMSTQCMFDPTLQLERDRGLNLWEELTPKIEGFVVTLADPPGKQALRFGAPLDGYAQSVDQRVKMAGWLELFESRGGNIIYHGVMTSDLEGLTELYDLTIIAAGRGDIVGLFDRDPDRSPYDRPQRRLSVIYLHGMTLPDDFPDAERVRISAIPGVGELFYMPCYTNSGPCGIVFWEIIPDGPLDVFGDRPDPKIHLERCHELMRQYLPWEYERCADAEPTDARCTLTGEVTPTVRKPVGRLSATSYVLGMADVVVQNDPIAGQGSNNAARCADTYFRAIVERGDRPFDPDWMQSAFDAYWERVQHSTAFSNALLAPLPEHVQRVLGAATQSPEVARRFAYGYGHPSDFGEWLLDPAKTNAYLESVMSE